MNNNQKQVVRSNNIATADTDSFYQGGENDVQEQVNLGHQNIDVPFHFRHTCWFCQEPAALRLLFPFSASELKKCSHDPISLPSCRECHIIAQKTFTDSIFQCREKVKDVLMKRYEKDLAVGKNWTQEELANSGFEGGSFEGFAKSAWFMFEVARDRVNFAGWPLWCNGVQIFDNSIGKQFIFDGVTYVDANQAVEFYVKTYDLNKAFFVDIIKVVGLDKFSYAIRYARIFVGCSSADRRTALMDLKKEQA